jgi:hypothetical protein
VKDLYTKNKSENTQTNGTISCDHGLERNIFKTLCYIVNKIPIKISMPLFTKIGDNY